MSNVLVFDHTPPPPAAHLRLRRLSRGLAILFTALMAMFALWVMGAFVLSFLFSDHVRIGPGGALIGFPHPMRPLPGTVLYSDQPFVTHLAGFVNVLVATAPMLFICWHLRGLFRLYAAGIVFARGNAAHLKQVGLWLVVYPVAKFAANMLFRLAGGTDTVWFRAELLYALVAGLIVFAIAQVMAFGQEIEQDRAEII
jgi:hypothetical protein